MNHTKYLYSKDKTKHRKLYFIIVAIFAGQLFHTQAKESEFIFTCQPYLQQEQLDDENGVTYLPL